jgi:two-component system, chemotaxis family, CheB/CheR fusion protein
MGRKSKKDGLGKQPTEDGRADVGMPGPQAPADDLEAQLAASLPAICALVRQRTGHDFASYKQGTLLRRIRRRLQVLHVAAAADYLPHLERDPSEADALVQNLLIGVTQFFRDPQAFVALAQHVLPLLVESKAVDAPLRIWVAGCASGEEAYSLAILVREHLERLDLRRLVQIFATDLDAELLAEARQGRYPLAIAEHVSPERLARFFVREGQTYHAAKELRDMCIFSQHSLIRDPPFSQLDLISCRNVFIYLGAELQKKLIPLLHYALRPGGFLFLGPSEGTASAPELFEAIDKTSRIFRRKETATRPALEFPLAARTSPRASASAPSAPPSPPVAAAHREKLAATFERIVLDEYCWPSLLVDERGDIVMVAGRVGRFLQPSGGALSSNVLDGARGSLRIELRAALQAACKSGRRVVRDPITVELEDTPQRLRVVVRPVPAADPASPLYLISLQARLAAGDEAEAEAALASHLETPALQQLDAELRATRTELKTSVEAADAAHEELKSSNEELIATNEELQSANEELQTSREELQSLNEELETVNAELREKVEALATANSDLQNLFAATEIATIFLDRSLRVAKFTPAATALFHLIDSDVGRPLADLAPRFAGQDLVADAREVLRALSPIERQVRAAAGNWFVLRVLPYRTIDNDIAGVLVTFVDVSAVKLAEEAARQQAELVHLSHDAIFVRRFDGTIESWNRGAEELYGFPPAEAIGKVSHALLATEFPKPIAEIEAELRHGGSWAGELRHRAQDGRTVMVLSNMQLARGADGQERLLEANRDITLRKQAEAEQQRLLVEVQAQRERLAALVGSMRDEVWFADTQRRFTLANPAAVREFTLGEESVDVEALAGSLEVFRADGSPRPIEEAPPLRALAGEAVLNQEEMIRTPGSGELRYREVNATPVKDAAGQIIGSVSVVRDITERVRAEAALRASEERFRTLASNAQDSITRFDREGRFVYVNPFAERLVGRPAAEILGRTAEELGRNAGTEPWEARLQEVFASGQPLRFDRRGVDGSWWDVQLTPELRDGQVVTALSMARDITQRRLAEEAAQDSRAKLAAALASMNEAVFIADASGRFSDFNQEFVRYHRFRDRDECSREIAECARYLEAYFEDGRPAPLDMWAMPRALRGEEGRNVEYRLRRKDTGEEWWGSYGFGPIRDPAGGIVGAVVSAREITERKQAEAVIRRSEARWNAAVDNFREGAIIATEAEQVIYWNPAARELHGMRSADEGKGPLADTPKTFELWTPDGSHRLELDEWPMRRIKRGETVHRLELRLRRPDQGWERIVAYSGAMVETASGERLIFLSLYDLTEQRKAELALREADRRKNEFLAVLSHELRNPLAPIATSLHVLDHAAPDSEPASRAKQVIGRQVAQLSHLVNDLLDITRITSNKVQLHRERLELAEIVRSAVEDNRSAFEQLGVRLDLAPALRATPVLADGARIVQVVGNLLQNAAKFTSPGGRTRVSVAAEGGEAVVRVADDGVGLAQETLGRLFQPFVQAEQSLDRSDGGLGLGLALVKGLVELHGGSVSAHSEGLGQGTEFVVRLPLDAGTEPQPARVRSPAAPVQRRILIIEDNADAADSLAEVLKLGNHEVMVAYSGTEGIAKARKFRPEVVLCDIGLPGMDGYEVARTLRTDQTLKGAYLVALSGYALPEDQQRAIASGFARHLAKPPSIETIEELLATAPPGAGEESAGG